MCVAVGELHLKALFAHFLALADTKHSGSSDAAAAQPHISKKGFMKALGAEDGSSLFIERIFSCMDGNRDGYLNFLGERTCPLAPPRSLGSPRLLNSATCSDWYGVDSPRLFDDS